MLTHVDSGPNRPRKALVVDDDARWRDRISAWLGATGLWVEEAGDLAAAEVALDRSYYHLAVLDLALDPRDALNVDGLRLVRKLSRMDEGTGVLLLTGFGSMSVGREATLYGAIDTIAKEELEPSSFVAEVLLAIEQAQRKVDGWLHRAPRMFRDQLASVGLLRTLEQSGKLDTVLTLLAGLVEGYQPVLPMKEGRAPRSSSVDKIELWFWSKILEASLETVVLRSTRRAAEIEAQNAMETGSHAELRMVTCDDMIGLVRKTDALDFEVFQRAPHEWLDLG